MSRSHAHDATRTRRSTTRSVAVLAVLITTVLPMAALAENNAQRPRESQVLDPQPRQSQGPWQAPVGPHQPRLQDLPPSLQREEEGGGNGRTRAQEDFDKGLQICKGC